MSEKDEDPQQDEFTDPTASADWTAPHAPQSQPTKQIPQGSETAEAPYQAPRGAGNPYPGSSTPPTNPYAATPPPPPADPYAAPQAGYDPYAATGARAPQGGYPAYNAPGQWQGPPPAHGAPPAQNTSALVLTILSGIITVTCCIPGVVPLILGIMALTKNASDPEASRRLTKWGWITFGVGVALAVLAVGVFVAFGVVGSFDGGYSSDSDYTY